MDPFTMALLFGGAGLAKNLVFDMPREKRERAAAAETQRWSPYTKMQAAPIHEANPFQDTMNFGLTGAAFGQNLAKFNAAQKLGPGTLAKTSFSPYQSIPSQSPVTGAPSFKPEYDPSQSVLNPYRVS